MIINKLKNERNRSSTKANYYGIWRKFNEFFIRLDRKPDTWEERLVLFVGFLISQNRKSNTIRSYVSAIKSVLKEDGQQINEDIFLLKSLTKACKLVNDRVKTRLPIRKPLLKLILSKVDTVFKELQPYLTILYKAILVTAYFGLFRIGEVCESIHVIKAKDVHIGRNKKKMMFILHTSKTHWLDVKPQIVKINSMQKDSAKGNDLEANKICPFSILSTYLQLRPKRKTDFEQFFVFRDRTSVSPSHMRSILKKLIIDLGLNESYYGFQSLRGGRASDLVSMGISIPVLKILGRWRSSAVLTYLRA